MMWFKNAQIFRLSSAITYNPDGFAQQLEPLAFAPCLPSLPSSYGWVAPLQQANAPLVHGCNGYMMFCLQIEDKILPGAVIRHAVEQKVMELEAETESELSYREKRHLKEDIVQTLMPRAFSKYTRIYAYIDLQQQWLVLDTVSKKNIEAFVSAVKKTLGEGFMTPVICKDLGKKMTKWIQQPKLPTNFEIKKACVLQDPREQGRVIRCSEQDLSATPIQALVGDGCDIKQLAMIWQDRVHFNLNDSFALQRIVFDEQLLEQAEVDDEADKAMVFDADFAIMSASLSALLKQLMELISPEQAQHEARSEVADFV